MYQQYSLVSSQTTGKVLVVVRDCGAHLAMSRTNTDQETWVNVHEQCFAPNIGLLRSFQIHAERAALKLKMEVLKMMKYVSKEWDIRGRAVHAEINVLELGNELWSAWNAGICAKLARIEREQQAQETMVQIEEVMGMVPPVPMPQRD